MLRPHDPLTLGDEFLKELLKGCKKLGIHRAVDTSGYVDREVLSSVLADVETSRTEETDSDG